MKALKKEGKRVTAGFPADRDLNKLKSDFVTLASHEFRTPLTTIQSSAYLLENYITGENKDKVSKHISRILNSVNTLTSMLDEFLCINRIEEGKVNLKMERINLRHLIENICSKSSDFLKTGQRIVYQQNGAQDINSNTAILSSILNTLISNASRYSPEYSDILITSDVGHQIHISVKDTGIGIPAEDQAYLFERFFRASNAAHIQGTGLGLHIMKLYLDMLQGTVQVNSAAGQGSEFSITFHPPVVQA